MKASDKINKIKGMRSATKSTKRNQIGMKQNKKKIERNTRTTQSMNWLPPLINM